MKVLHSTQATAVGGRGGWVASVDGKLKVRLSRSRSLGGADGTSPEHLFAAAYAVGFLDALRTAATETGRALTDDANVTVTVGLGRPDGGDGLALDLALSLDLPDLDHETAQILANRAHALCPYSRALRDRLEPRTSIA